jgi:hypothetical protein
LDLVALGTAPVGAHDLERSDRVQAPNVQKNVEKSSHSLFRRSAGGRASRRAANRRKPA